MNYKNDLENNKKKPINIKYSKDLAILITMNSLLKLYLVTPNANTSKGAGRGRILKKNMP